MQKTYYKGQALAIVMVVLVVISIIGIALFSRMTKDRRSVINQQDSASAQEQADAILNLFLGVDIDALEQKLKASTENELFFDGNETPGELMNFLATLDIGIDTSSLTDFDLCEGSGSSVIVRLGFTDESEPIEVQPGSSRVYYLDGATFEEGTTTCNMEVNAQSVGSYTVFVEKIVYNDGTEEMYPSCVGDSCDSVPADEVPYFVDSADSGRWVGSINTYDLFELVVDLGVSEIRLLPINGTLRVGESVQDCIKREFRYSKVIAEVNCNGSYRAKEMYIPGSGSLGYPTLFDYVIYDTGVFIP